MNFKLDSGEKLNRALWNAAIDGLVTTEDFPSLVQDILSENLHLEFPTGNKGNYEYQVSTFKAWSVLTLAPVGQTLSGIKVYVKPHNGASLTTQVRVRVRNGLLNTSPIVATGTVNVTTALNVETECTVLFAAPFTVAANILRVDVLANGNVGFLGTTDVIASYNATWSVDATLTVDPIPDTTPTTRYLYAVWVRDGVGVDISPIGTFGQPDILLPRNIFIFKASGEQINFYHRNMVTGEWGKMQTTDWFAAIGKQLNDCYRIEANVHAVGDYSCVVSVKLPDTRLVTSRTTNLKIVDSSNTATINVNAIGDSKTYGTIALAAAIAKLPGTKTTFGLRKWGTTYAEGREGWTVAMYLTAGTTNGFESPFMFPIGVSATNYRGNTEFWKQVMMVETSAPGNNPFAFGFFTEAAKGGGGSYIYNSTTGYPLSPTTGWVVYDPALGGGSRFQEWNGSAWVAMASQPAGYELRYDKYLTRWGFSTPTVVVINLMANDWFNGSGILDFTTWIANYTALITNIKANVPAARILIALSEQVSDQDAAGTVYGAGLLAENVRRNYQQATRALLNAFDTDSWLGQSVYVVPYGAVVDPRYGFGLNAAEAPNKYSSETIKRVADLIHPSAAVGYLQVGDILAGALQGTR